MLKKGVIMDREYIAPPAVSDRTQGGSVTVMLPQDQYFILDRYARKRKISKAALIREIVNSVIENYDQGCHAS